MQKLEGRSRDYLYFFGTANRIKIGRTSDLDGRLSKIQTSCPDEIEWAVGWPGRGDEEKDWHSAFAGCHVRGEWFEASDELRAAIRRQSIKPPAHPEEVQAAYNRLFGRMTSRESV